MEEINHVRLSMSLTGSTLDSPPASAHPDYAANGEGEMARLVQSFDWAATPFGPLPEWPQSLRTAVSIVLGSRFPMFIWWGRAMTNLYNDAYAPMLGQRHPGALGRSAFEVWADVWPICGPQAEAVLKEGKSTWNEELLLIVERNGFTEEAYFTFSYSPATDDSGRPGGVFCAVIEDTPRVLARRRLKTLRDLGERGLLEGLSESQACHAAAEVLAQNPHDFPFALIYLLDSDGSRARLTDTVNYERHRQASPDEIILNGKADLWNFQQVLRANRGHVIENLTGLFGRMPAGPWHDDQTRRALVLPLAKAGVQDLPAGFLVAGISPRLALNEDYRGFLEMAAGHIATAIANARAYQEERQRAEALQELDRAKTAFFSNVSHEFRTPLTLMLGPLEELLARENASLSPSQREQLLVAHRNSLRLLKLVNTLLDFSRLEAGRVDANYEPTDLAEFTGELCSVFRAAVEKAGLRLEVDCPSLPDTIYADRDMWEKIVLNLLSNAFKFTFDGGIKVELKKLGPTAELRVRDTGIGIPPEELGNVFKRFHRVEGARGRTFEGSGIGLALVQELVKLHGGSITVSSVPGQGTEFVVTIPFGKEHLPPDRIAGRKSLPATALKADAFVEEALRWLPDAGKTQAAPITQDLPAAGILAPASGAHILLADDNADMREYLRRLLAGHYQVTAVADGESALKAARQHKPDLILSDVMMPRLDGIALVQAIRTDPQLQTIPLILLSARTGEESRVQGLAAGADDYLTKPFSARELVARVESHLKMSQLRAEAFERERKLRDELEEQRRRAHDLIDSITDGFLALDSAWRFTYVNKMAERLLGKTAGELIGRNLWELYPDTLGTIVEHEFQRAVAEQVNVEFQNFYEPWQRWFDLKAYPSAGGLAVHFRDISARKNAERNLEEAHRRLAEQVEGLSRLHELSTRLLTTRETQPMLSSILESIAALHHTDRGLLWLADPESGQLRVGAALNFDPAKVEQIERVAAFMGPSLEAVRQRRRVIIENTDTHPLSPEYREVARVAGFRAVHCTPVLARDGRALGVVSVHFTQPHVPTEVQLQLTDMYARQAADFLEQTRIEQALQLSEERFRLAAFSDAITMYEQDRDLRYLWLYPSHPEHQNALGRTDAELLPDDQGKQLAEWKREVINTGRAQRREARTNLPSGARVYDIFILPRRNAAGEIIGVSGTALDITERKRDEMTHRLLGAIVESSDDAIISKDLHGIIQSWNQGAERIFGYTAAEIVGRSITLLIPPDRWDEEQRILERIRRGQRIFHFETVRRRKDGSFLDVSLTVSPIIDTSGAVIGASKIARDITDRVRAKEKLEQAVADRTQSLREAIAQMEEFSYSVSHDLRSPVRAMHGYATVLAEDYGEQLPAQARDFIQRIIHSSARMERLIHDVLTYSRANRVEMKLQALSLNDLLRAVIAQYPELHSDRAEIVIPEHLPLVLGHEPSLAQAVANLLSNAVKFVAPGVKPKVRVIAEQKDGRVTVTFLDNGIGIKPEYQGRLFGLFERIHPDGKYEGTGVGLAIVRKTVERMGGKVGVTSDGVNGSAFWIELPAPGE